MDGSTWTGLGEEAAETDNSNARAFKFSNTRGYQYYGILFKSGSYKNVHQLRVTGIEYEFFPQVNVSNGQIFHLTSSLTSSTVTGITSGSPVTPEISVKYVKQNQNGTTVDITEGVYLETIVKGKIFGDGLYGDGEASSSAYFVSASIGQFETGSSANDTARRFIGAINSSSINLTASLDNFDTSTTVQLKQNIEGEAGNTIITI